MAKRIVHIITSLDCGGAENMLLRLLGAMHNRELVVICLRPIGSLKKEVSETNAEMYSLEINGILSGFLALFRLRRLAQKVQADMYWGWMYHGALCASLARLFWRAPVAWNIRQTLYSLKKEKVGTQLVICLLRLFSRSVSMVVFNSKMSRVHHAPFIKSRPTTLLPNGFDVSQYAVDSSRRLALREHWQIPDDALVIGHAARFHPMKGHQLFSAAVENVCQRMQSVYVVCCGRGVSEDMFPAVIRPYVRCLGEVDPLRHFYPGLDVFCSSSQWGEGFSNVLAEAMLFGLPCVACDVGENAEIVLPYGRVVARGSAEALADGLHKTLVEQQEEALNVKVERSNSIRDRFALVTVSAQYANLEDSIIEHC